MAVTVVRTAQGADAALSTNATGGDCLDITITWRDNAGQTVSGVTFNGVSATRIGTDMTSGGAGISKFRLASPDQTTANVAVTFSSAPPSYQLTCNVLTGVDTSNPVGDTDQSNGAGSATSTPSVSAATDDLVIDALMTRGTSSGFTAGTDQTALSAQQAADSVYQRTSSKLGASSVTMSWTWSTSNTWVHKVVVYNHASSGSSVTGTGASTAPAATSSGTGTRGVNDFGSVVELNASAATVAATGTVTPVGDAITGSGALTAGAATVDGTGGLAIAITGSGALQAAVALVAATGIRAIFGTGALTAPAGRIRGRVPTGRPGVVGTGVVGTGVVGTGVVGIGV